MTSRALPPSIWSNLTALLRSSDKAKEAQARSKLSPDYRQAEHDCVKDFIWDHPELFSCELDVQNSMRMYRGRF